MTKDIRYKKGSAKNCTKEGCFGDPSPEKIICANNFKGTICSDCYAVIAYWDESGQKEPSQEKQEKQKEKLERIFEFPKFTDAERSRIHNEYEKLQFKKHGIKPKPKPQLDLFTNDISEPSKKIKLKSKKKK